MFGLYWAMRYRSPIVWRRNLTIIATRWTVLVGHPDLAGGLSGPQSLDAADWPVAECLAVENGRIPGGARLWGRGDPAWWHTVAVVGVVWAVC